MNSNHLSIYFHWPFCESKCPYCDFNSYVSKSINQKDWLRAYKSELITWANLFDNLNVRSIFFGGGTPSLMEPKLVYEILETIQQNFLVSDNVEISLEANPSSVEKEKFKDYAATGINRISIGVQSFNDKDLKYLGRKHSSKEAINAVTTGLRYFKNNSLDLIYARQFQTLKDWHEELSFALSLETQHLSLYQLTIEKNTRFGLLFEKGKMLGLPTDKLNEDLFNKTRSLCHSEGFYQYEISNFAKTGYQCKHNLNYWRAGNFLGLGPGAHGRYECNGSRYSYEATKTPEIWLKKAIDKKSNVKNLLKMSKLEQFEEYIMMGLRLSDGVDLHEMSKLFKDSYKLKNLNYLMELGLLEYDEKTLKILPKGRLILNSIVKELLA